MGGGIRNLRGGIRTLRRLLKRKGVADALRADLLERGRSLSELGHTLRWTEIRALLTHLPPTSATKRLLNPTAARDAMWTTPEVTILGMLYDQTERTKLTQAGIDTSQWPPPLLTRIITQINNPQTPEQPAQNPTEKALTTAEEIRAGL